MLFGALVLAVGGVRAQGLLPGGFADSLVLGGLDLPTGFAFLPDRRVLVIEQKSARIRLIVNGALAPTDPVATLPSVATAGDEQGLLGIAVDPGWPARPYLYIHCDNALTSTIRLSRYTATGDLAFTGNGALAVDPATRYDVLNDAPDVHTNHNGGTLRFGLDGKLFDSLGEDGVPCAAQDTVSLRGVILRLDVSGLPDGAGGPAPRALITPAGNPFASHPNANARLVWALGLRNPFRFEVDPLDGSLWVGDVGESRFEEVDHVTAPGLCLGWPAYEATTPHTNTCTNVVRGTDPVYFYDRTGFTAAVICAGPYHRPAGAAAGFPSEYEGNVFLNDYYAGFLRRLAPVGGGWNVAPPVGGQPDPANWGTGFQSVSDWAVGPDGALWYCRQANAAFNPNTGQIRRIVSKSTLGVPPQVVSGLHFLPPAPSPARGSTRLAWILPRAGLVELTLHDAGGRMVRRLVSPESEPPGPHSIPWDGLDDHGREVRPGLYIARLIVDGHEVERRFPLLR